MDVESLNLSLPVAWNTNKQQGKALKLATCLKLWNKVTSNQHPENVNQEKDSTTLMKETRGATNRNQFLFLFWTTWWSFNLLVTVLVWCLQINNVQYILNYTDGCFCHASNDIIVSANKKNDIILDYEYRRWKLTCEFFFQFIKKSRIT